MRALSTGPGPPVGRDRLPSALDEGCLGTWTPSASLGAGGAGLPIIYFKFSRMAVIQPRLILSVKRLCREDCTARRPVEPMFSRPRRNTALRGAPGPRPVRWRSRVERRMRRSVSSFSWRDFVTFIFSPVY